ncbi:Fic family protein [Haloplasma contractile]|uniref:Fic-DOC family protein n=1 Tax=Haloplasma contractile SSD-17B TaxID=1033810 RepID=F7PZN0_9MOLU|nr:Fic family protein [Haloplasma contractile]ERJ13285.1 Fic-DOC family protein [Haloplasma contractile SSD-17B]
MDYKSLKEVANKCKDLHQIVKATLLHGEFVKIHPFVDGDGRTARILLKISLMKDGLVRIIITKDQRLFYYEG